MRKSFDIDIPNQTVYWDIDKEIVLIDFME